MIETSINNFTVNIPTTTNNEFHENNTTSLTKTKTIDIFKDISTTNTNETNNFSYSRYKLFKQTINNSNGNSIDIFKYGAELNLVNVSKENLLNDKRRKKRARKSEQLNWEKILREPLKNIDPNQKNVIYKITNKNKINNDGTHKFYIGKTKNELGKRMVAHFRNALLDKGCPNIRKAIRKYGVNSFDVEVLYSGKNINKKEHELIKEYNATDKKIGYNIAN